MTITDLHRKIAEENETPIGVDRLSRIANGRQVNYHTDTLWKIARALDVDVSEVYEPPVEEQQADESGATTTSAEEKE